MDIDDDPPELQEMYHQQLTSLLTSIVNSGNSLSNSSHHRRTSITNVNVGGSGSGFTIPTSTTSPSETTFTDIHNNVADTTTTTTVGGGNPFSTTGRRRLSATPMLGFPIDRRHSIQSGSSSNLFPSQNNNNGNGQYSVQQQSMSQQQCMPQQQQQQRRRSIVGNLSQEERRKIIKEILSDAALNGKEKSLAIQSLMDGRKGSTSRRSSIASYYSQSNNSITSDTNNNKNNNNSSSNFINHNNSSNYNDNSTNQLSTSNDDTTNQYDDEYDDDNDDVDIDPPNSTMIQMIAGFNSNNNNKNSNTGFPSSVITNTTTGSTSGSAYARRRSSNGGNTTISSSQQIQQQQQQQLNYTSSSNARRDSYASDAASRYAHSMADAAALATEYYSTPAASSYAYNDNDDDDDNDDDEDDEVNYHYNSNDDTSMGDNNINNQNTVKASATGINNNNINLNGNTNSNTRKNSINNALTSIPLTNGTSSSAGNNNYRFTMPSTRRGSNGSTVRYDESEGTTDYDYDNDDDNNTNNHNNNNNNTNNDTMAIAPDYLSYGSHEFSETNYTGGVDNPHNNYQQQQQQWYGRQYSGTSTDTIADARSVGSNYSLGSLSSSNNNNDFGNVGTTTTTGTGTGGPTNRAQFFQSQQLQSQSQAQQANQNNASSILFLSPQCQRASQKKKNNTTNTNTRTGLSQAAAAPPYKQFHGRSMSLQDWTDSDRANVAAVGTDTANDFISLYSKNPKMLSKLMEQSRPQCTHYDRNCSIISPCCGLAFGCRICHDECPVLPQPLSMRQRNTNTNNIASNGGKKNTQMNMVIGAPPIISANTCTVATTGSSSIMDGLGFGTRTNQHIKERRRSMPLDIQDVLLGNTNDDQETHHLIDRFQIREVICRTCFERQSSKTNNCIKCGTQFGEYHCNICNLWMSNNELPYHCEQCGFCRVGGRENFTHCNDCGMCIDSQLFDDHNCKAGKYMSNCPICQEDLFSSRFASHEMPCGHAIHWDCFKELTSYDTRCPVCKKTAENPEHMQVTWSAIAMGIAIQPVPPELVRVVNILCNDCEVSDTNRRWHFLGVQCLKCTSFNTVVENIVLTGYEGAAFLDSLEQVQQQQQQQNMNMDDDDNDNGPLENGIPTSIIGIPTSITAMTNTTSFRPTYSPSNDYFTSDNITNDEDMDM